MSRGIGRVERWILETLAYSGCSARTLLMLAGDGLHEPSLRRALASLSRKGWDRARRRPADQRGG